MRISDPIALELAYIRDMMAWLLFLEPPERILQLGLGAASLTKFCLRHCRRSEVSVVEVSEVVIDAAYQWFRLPRPGPQDGALEVVCMDAGAYVALRNQHRRFGVIQVDLYDREAAGPVLDSAEFYADCHRCLAEPGVMVVNLFGRAASFKRSVARIERVFGQVVMLAPREEGNLVVLALKGPSLRVTRRALFERATQVQSRYSLPARGWAKTLQSSLTHKTGDIR